VAKLGWRVTEWNDEALYAKADEALVAYATALSPLFDEQITTRKWVWPRDTKRKSGQFVLEGNRDIVDLGNLLRSKKQYRPEPFTVKFLWDVPYSGEVLVGMSYVGNKGRVVKFPARNWIRPAVYKYPIAAGVAIAWRALPAA
jgi:hypothetical protein